MSFSALWQLVKHSMKSALKCGSRDSKRRQPLQIHRKAGTRLLLEVLEDRSLLSTLTVLNTSDDITNAGIASGHNRQCSFRRYDRF